jgi:talin
LVSSGSINRNSENSRQSSNDLDYSAGLLSDAAKNMVTNVQSLLKTVKTVEDEAARGTRALESAIEAIYQEIKLYSSYINDFKKQSIDETDHHHQSNGNSLNVSTNPEDLIKATKQITLATSKAIGAGNSLRQEDIITAANMGRKAVSDLLFVSRGANNLNLNKYNSHQNLEDQPNQIQVLSVGLNCAIYYKELLECIQAIFNKQSLNDNKQNLLLHSKNVANAVSEIIQVAEILKGSDWIDPEDPTVIAENELLGAANAIESAAKKLSILKPRSRTEVSALVTIYSI